MEIQSTKQDWFYDDREYYNYVLLNSSQEIYLKVQNSLSLHDIRVLKAAASFRPASNGIQYKWYIRIEGKNNKPPSREQIKSILDEVFITEVKQVPQPIPPKETPELALKVKIAELEKNIEQKAKEFDSVNSKLTRFEKEKKLLQSQLKTAKADLEQSQQEVEKLLAT